jgi:hypothetical protein
MSDDTTPEPTASRLTQPDPRSLVQINSSWAGSFSIAVDINEFILLFSQPLVGLSPTGATEMPLVPSVAVTMSPVLAKDLAKVLQESVNRYEQEHNTVIPSPRQIAR